MLSVASTAEDARAAGPEYSKAGPYLGLGAAFGFDDFDLSDYFDIDPAYGLDVWAGYRFHPHVAAETQIEYLNGFKTELHGFELSKNQTVTWTTNLKAFLLTGRFQPFAYVGIGLGWQQIELSIVDRSADFLGFAARFGGGVDFYITEHLALQANASYVLPTGELDGFGYTSMVVGAQFRF